jgi:hypothetical protein
MTKRDFMEVEVEAAVQNGRLERLLGAVGLRNGRWRLSRDDVDRQFISRDVGGAEGANPEEAKQSEAEAHRSRPKEWPACRAPRGTMRRYGSSACKTLAMQQLAGTAPRTSNRIDVRASRKEWSLEESAFDRDGNASPAVVSTLRIELDPSEGEIG